MNYGNHFSYKMQLTSKPNQFGLSIGLSIVSVPLYVSPQHYKDRVHFSSLCNKFNQFFK